MKHEIRCEHCNNWTNARKKRCEHCGEYAKKVYHQKKVKKEDPLKPQLISISENDPILIKLGKYAIRFSQIVFYMIVAFVIYLSSITVG